MAEEGEEDFYGGRLTCACGSKDFMQDVDGDEGEHVENIDDVYLSQVPALCLSCGEQMTYDQFPWVKMYEHFFIGRIESAEAVKKLMKLSVSIKNDVGTEEDDVLPLTVVTNDTKVSVGDLIVIATVGAIVPAGKTEDDGGELVKKTSVGGIASHGMVCDATMLSWVGGGKGTAVKMEGEKFKPGMKPPPVRPGR